MGGGAKNIPNFVKTFSNLVEYSAVCTLRYFYPHAFLKKQREYCNHPRPSVCYAISSYTVGPNQPNFVYELLT